MEASEARDAALEAFDTVGAALAVCGADLELLYLNEKAAETFAAQGGASLVGGRLEACHKAASVALMRRMLETGEPHVYTISKGGKKKLIWQGVWRSQGKVGGLVEISLPLPEELPHFDRG